MLLRYVISIMIYVLTTLACGAQVSVTGVVVEQGSGDALAGASVVLRDDSGKIRKYGTTDADGKFALPATSTSGWTLDVSMMSFAKQAVALDSVLYPLTVVLEPSATMLREVAVKADRIREQGDTAW